MLCETGAMESHLCLETSDELQPDETDGSELITDQVAELKETIDTQKTKIRQVCE